MDGSTKKVTGTVQANRDRYAARSVTRRLAARIRFLMDKLHLTALDVSKLSGVSQRNVYRIINCECSTSLETAEAICEALKTTLAKELAK